MLQPSHISLPSIDILAGDFNCDDDPELNAFVSTFGIFEVSPSNPTYIFRFPQGRTSKHDHIYVTSPPQQRAFRCIAVTPPKSLHLLLFLDLNLREISRKSPGLWKLHPSTLNSQERRQTIESSLQGTPQLGRRQINRKVAEV